MFFLATIPVSSGFVKHPLSIEMAVKIRVMAPNELHKSIMSSSLLWHKEQKIRF